MPRALAATDAQAVGHPSTDALLSLRLLRSLFQEGFVRREYAFADHRTFACLTYGAISSHTERIMQLFQPPTRATRVPPVSRHIKWTWLFMSNTVILMLGFVFFCVLFLFMNLLSFPVNRYLLPGLLVLFVPNFFIGLAQSRLFAPQINIPFALISSISWPISFLFISLVVILFELFNNDDVPISTASLGLLTIFLAGCIVGFGQGRVIALPRTQTFRWIGVNIAGYLFITIIAYWFGIVQLPKQ